MTACNPAPARTRRPADQRAGEAGPNALPAKPDQRLWKTDKARAFEAGVRWFLAVSRAA